MNIFVLHNSPIVSARYMIDKHVVKMVLETAQLLCSMYPEGTAPYKRTHYNHPCAKWVRKSKENYLWLVRHGIALNEEYRYRWERSRDHASLLVILWCLKHMKQLQFVQKRRTPFALAMPEECRQVGHVESYRTYYKQCKRDIATWKRREIPEWWK